VTWGRNPTLTQLTDEGGTPGTVETMANGRLALVAGSIAITPSAAAAAVPTLSTWAMVLTALSRSPRWQFVGGSPEGLDDL
jgi:hypothetical protein